MASNALSRLQPALVFALALAIVLPGLGSAGLLDPWEMDRAAVARTLAGPAQVVSTFGADADKALGEALGADFTVRTAAGGLSRVGGELNAHITHALVVDVAGGLGIDERAAILDVRAAELDNLKASSPGMAIVLVGDEPAAAVRERIARARARALHRALQGGFWRALMPEAKRADELAPLLDGGEPVVASAGLADWLRAHTPSPWLLPQHRVDRAAAPVPVLDAWAVALSLRVFGASEFAARLPGALIFALLAALLFWGLRRHAGDEPAWLAVLVFASLPMALGPARVLTLASTPALGLLLVVLALQRVAEGGLGAFGRVVAALVLLDGLVVLLLGGGLGGLAMGAAAAVVFAALRGGDRDAWALAALAGVTMALAAGWVLGDEQAPLLRALRFTRVPFAGGLGEEDRDLSVIIGQVGFGLHPWGGLFLLGAGRALFAGEGDDPRGHAALWLIGFGVALLTTALLMPTFQHAGPPVAPFAAALTGLLLAEVRRGAVRGPLLSLFVVLSVLLLHRETGKDAGTLVRAFTWDPPFGGEAAAFQWPEELKMPRWARAVGLLGVAACALTLARPVALVRALVLRLDGALATAWTVGGLLTLWALDCLISMGIRLDVLLRAEASRTGYGYDRMWLTVQSIRPEVIVGAALFVASLVGVGVTQLGPEHGLRRALARLRPLAAPKVAAALLAIAAAGALVAGLMVHTAVAQQGVGAALVAGLMRPIFFLPLAVAAVALLWRLLGARLGRPSSSSSSSSSSLAPSRGGALAALVVALAGVGAGASQLAGTWSYGYYIAAWGVAVGLLALAAGAPTPRAALARTALATGVVTAAGLFIAMAERLLGLSAEGRSAIVRTLVAAPDTALLLLLAAAAAANHLATRWAALATLRARALALVGWGERPSFGVGAAGVGAVLLAGGYAYGLLPEMSVHFSQKHLLAAISAAGGGDASAGFVDEQGTPMAFKYPGTAGAKVLGSNFYTAALPTIAARDEALAVLAGDKTKVQVKDWGESARSAELELAGGKRFVIVPKAEFSAFNYAYREKNHGRSVQVLDASSSRLVLAASALPPDQPSRNWLDDAVLTPEAFAKLAGVHKLTANFDDKLILRGWRLGEASVRRSQKYHLELYFEVKSPVDVSYKLFMHPHPLHRDLWPLAVAPDTEAEAKRCTGCFQTNHWRVGDVVRFDVDQEVPLGTSTGPQDIILGFYDPLTDKRLPLGEVTGAGVVRHNDNRVTIGRLLVR